MSAKQGQGRKRNLLCAAALLLSCAAGLKAEPIVIFSDTIALNVVIHQNPFAVLEADTRGVAEANVGNLGAVAVGAINPVAPNALLFAVNLPSGSQQESVDLQYASITSGAFDPTAPIYATVPAIVTPFNGSSITDPALQALLGVDYFTFQFVSGTPVVNDVQTITFDLIGISTTPVPEPSTGFLMAIAMAGLSFAYYRYSSARRA